MTPAVSTGSAPRRRWRLVLGCLTIIGVAFVAGFWAIGGFDVIADLRSKPASAFDAAQSPPPPDYSRFNAWLAFPGRNGLERSTAPGTIPVVERAAPADVFFVAPTTFKGSAVWNASYDAPEHAAPLNPPVLLDQVSVFNGCCRMYAPHYRQATLAALKTPAAMDVAYGDVARAFRFYLEHLNRGRPFIIASHSQGTAHAIRLLQEEVLGKPLRSRLIAAYLIGGYVPDTFGQLGLPVCDSAAQIGCVISYNTSQTGRSGARLIVDNRAYWWRGAHLTNGNSHAICVNPLTWTRRGSAPALSNAGSLPFPAAPFGVIAKRLPKLVVSLTGAVCRQDLLEVDIPWSAPAGFIDKLSLVMGSYHLNDYGIFYDALRRNAVERTAAWLAADDNRRKR